MTTYPSENRRICRVTVESGKMKITENNILQEDCAMKDELDFAGHDLQERFDASARPVIRVDVEKYQAFLDSADMTDAQKEEFLQSLWFIIVSFVEHGFGVHPLQEVCGKDHKSEAHSPKADFNRLGSSNAEDKKTGRDMPPRLEAE